MYFTKCSVKLPALAWRGKERFCFYYTVSSCIISVMSAQTYKSNRHIFYSCKYHVVFCPKYRRKVLVNGIDIRLKEIIQQVADELECEIIELEVMPDHVHMLCEAGQRS